MAQYSFITASGSVASISSGDLNLRGDWLTSVDYAVRDVVTFNDRLFMALSINNSVQPPSAITTDVPSVWTALILDEGEVETTASGSRIVLDPSLTSIQVSPSGNKTVVTWSDTVGQVGSVTTVSFDVDSTQSQVGDEMLIFLKLTPDNGGLFVVFTSNFFLTHCGSTNDNNTESVGIFERWMWTFWFDGEKWLDTQDNC